MASLIQDVRYALRTLRRSPGLVAVVVLSLALGMGANSLIYSVVNGVVFHPFRFPDAERVVLLGAGYPSSASSGASSRPSRRETTPTSSGRAALWSTSSPSTSATAISPVATGRSGCSRRSSGATLWPRPAPGPGWGAGSPGRRGSGPRSGWRC